LPTTLDFTTLKVGDKDLKGLQDDSVFTPTTAPEPIMFDDFLSTSLFAVIAAVAMAAGASSIAAPAPQRSMVASQEVVTMPTVVVTGHRPESQTPVAVARAD